MVGSRCDMECRPSAFGFDESRLIDTAKADEFNGQYHARHDDILPKLISTMKWRNQ